MIDFLCPKCHCVVAQRRDDGVVFVHDSDRTHRWPPGSRGSTTCGRKPDGRTRCGGKVEWSGSGVIVALEFSVLA